MEFEKAISEAGLAEFSDVLRTGWNFSCRVPPEKISRVLSRSFIEKACRDLFLYEEVIKPAVRAGEIIRKTPALSGIFRHGSYCLFDLKEYRSGNRFGQWPPAAALEKFLGKNSGMFYLLLLISGIEAMKSVHREHSVPQRIIKDTLSDINNRLDIYKNEHGCFGLSPAYLTWLVIHLRGEIYRLGRLQFQLCRSKFRLRAFRNISTNKVIAVSESGAEYLEDGQLPASDYPGDRGRVWTGGLEVSAEGVRANPVLPTGRALNQKIFLPADEWVQVFGPEDPVLAIHIPRGGSMDFHLCGESFRTAIEFFSTHFPGWTFEAFTCGSWLLDSRLEKLLPPESNMVRFQKEGYLFPGLSNPDALLNAVFGAVPGDISKAPRDTSLRRAVADSILEGKNLYPGAGGFFLLKTDLKWGSMAYRTDYDFIDELISESPPCS